MSEPILISAPATDAVDFDLLKDSLNVDYDDKDSLIQVYLQAATDDAEKWTGRAFIDQTWDVFLDGFPTTLWPGGNFIEIPKPPLIEVIGLFHQDSNGDEQEFFGFAVDEGSTPSRLYLPTNGSWPTANTVPDAVRVRFRAGYLNADSPPVANVPYKIQAAIMLLTRAYFDPGENETNADKCRESAWRLLRDYRVERGMA